MIPAVGLVVVVAAGCSSTTCYLLRCMVRVVFTKFNVLLIINLLLRRSPLSSSKPPAPGSGFDDKKVPLQ